MGTGSFTYTAGQAIDIHMVNNGAGSAANTNLVYTEFTNAH
jgi:hypothetical protein